MDTVCPSTVLLDYSVGKSLGGESVINSKLLLRPQEAAESLGISRAKVYALLADGTLPRVKVGSSIRVPLAALEQWVVDRQAFGEATDR
jgi:excisionase family DNA binding protein